MKLRNKKTGKVYELECITVFDRPGKDDIGDSIDEFYAIADLNEEWEDYKPAKPLIKDEKIRKAVRAWAEANGIENEAFYLCTPFYRLLRISTGSRSIEFPNDGRFGQIDFTKGYTIAELCGEEEE